MKKHFTNTIKPFLNDRPVFLVTLLVVILAIAYSIYVGVSLRPSDLQVAVHYTAFGETTFYRNKWFYLLSFVAFGFIFAVVHTLLIGRLYAAERRQLAIAFAWLSIFVIIIAFIVTQSIIGIAFL